jgi:phospholipid/cholesterol/gamma-HCH transport system ATP-binding protein
MIQTRGLSKRFEDWVFRNISFEVPQGKSVVILGPSGGGKSVLLKVLAGLLPADEGDFKIETSNLGMLFQKNALFDSFTVLENLLFPLRERRGLVGEAAKKISLDMLASVGLSEAQNQFPDEISGGMQKRLGIARALVVEPELILYDEPTAGLDPITSRTIADLIIRLREKQKSTLLIVTNDVHRAYQLGDEIYLLAEGELIRAGTPQQTRDSREPRIHQFMLGLKTGPLTDLMQ